MRAHKLSIVVVTWLLLCPSVSASTISRVKTWANGDILTAADLNAEYNNILNDYNGSVSTANFATTLTWGATGNQYLDISAIASSTTKGLRLPTGSTGGTNAGQIAWDNTAKALRVGDGAAADFDVLTAAQGTAGQLLRSAGGNALQTWTTPTYPNASGSAGVLIRSDGTNFGTSTPTFPNTGGTAGQWLRTDGTNYGLSTPTLPNSFVQGDILYASAANVLTALGPGTSNQVLQTKGVAANPVWATVIPTLVSANGGTTTTTTSTSFVDMTDMTVTFTPSQTTDVLTVFTCHAQNSGANTVSFQLVVDGSAVATSERDIVISAASAGQSVSIGYVNTSLSAAAHTIKVQWLVSSGTAQSTNGWRNISVLVLKP